MLLYLKKVATTIYALLALSNDMMQFDQWRVLFIFEVYKLGFQILVFTSAFVSHKSKADMHLDWLDMVFGTVGVRVDDDDW